MVGAATTGPLVRLLGAGPEVADPATTYLRIAFLGVTPLLVMLATTGILRGLQDTRTPLAVAVAGNALNIALNLVLVYGVAGFDGLGIAGSALGSVLAQVASAAALLAVVVRGARREGAGLRPDAPGIRRAAQASVALVIRTLTLRAALLLTTYAVVLGAGSTSGDDQSVSVATHQLAFTIWSFLAFALDAIAIAAQAITGRFLGAGDREGTRAVTRRMVWWGAVSGVGTGVALAAASPFLGPLFTDDARVHDLLVPVLLVAAAGQPVAGVVFVLDGVLIGAGDGTYLAWAGLAVLAVYAPVVLLVGAVGGGVVWVWVVLSALLMGARFLVLTRRARGEAWLVTGAMIPGRSPGRYSHGHRTDRPPLRRRERHRTRLGRRRAPARQRPALLAGHGAGATDGRTPSRSAASGTTAPSPSAPASRSRRCATSRPTRGWP